MSGIARNRLANERKVRICCFEKFLVSLVVLCCVNPVLTSLILLPPLKSTFDLHQRWKKEKPFGFYAKPAKKADGSNNLFEWKCGIPGKEGSDWEGGVYPITLLFPPEYPSKPPKCVFDYVLFHPNVYPSGTVCLSILNEDKGWAPTITVKQILVGIQTLLAEPNNLDPAQSEPFALFGRDQAAYWARVRKEVERFR